ncbi:MAG TPA: DNA polymerase III subunit chi [Hyphomicrobiales bacterium]|nr:DNA polymerase III subunit chi [Hyphomicrobiales bacterium]
MARINFYSLRHEDAHSRLLLACRLSEQLYRQGRPVRILANDEDEAHSLDQLLWQFTPESFVPHALRAAAPPDCPVLIDWQAAPFTNGNLLNLTAALPTDHSIFDSIAEFVMNSEAAKALGRQKWQAYKQAGHELQHHSI